MNAAARFPAGFVLSALLAVASMFSPATAFPASFSNATAVALGPAFGCAASRDGTVACWGANALGQLDGSGPPVSPPSGNYPTVDHPSSPIPLTVGLTSSVASVTGVSSLAAGGSHNCAIVANGQVVCWGSNLYGQLGSGSSAALGTATLVKGLSGASAVAAGATHTCALANGSVSCWGANNTGQLGNGTTGGASATTPYTVTGTQGATAIAAGTSHTCAALLYGEVYCWGANYQGQLGPALSNDSKYVVNSAQDSGIQGAISLGAGDVHTCAVLATGQVECWGDNTYGQLGNGTTTTNVKTATPVAGISNALAVTAGSAHSCALLKDGTVVCWGANSYGQLGNGTITASTTPVQVSGIAHATAISANGYATCAVMTGGALQCWGDGTKGQIATGSSSFRATAGPVLALGPINGTGQLAAGHFNTCVTTASTGVACWGSNSDGTLGYGAYFVGTSNPQLVRGVLHTTGIVVGYGYACATSTSGQAKCWGNDLGAEFGGADGSYTDVATPSANASNYALLAAGTAHMCGTTANGAVQCWGDNEYGQLGDGTNNYGHTPVTASGISKVTSLAAGWGHSCAVGSGGTVACWGYNNAGQLGDGTTKNSASPLVVPGISGAVAVTAGISHSCALLTDGSVNCWGSNYWGQLGSATGGPVPGIKGATAIAAGDNFTCAIVSYKVWCWGQGDQGELGNGVLSTSATPVQVIGVSDVASIALGSAHACALADEEVKCWGDDTMGQLGDSGLVFASTPISIVASDLDRLYGWAQQTYPALFGRTVPAGGVLSGYDYRYFPDTKNYLGVNNGEVYYLGADAKGAILDVGSFSNFFGMAAAAGY